MRPIVPGSDSQGGFLDGPDDSQPQYRLYSPAAIDLATFIGSMLAGSFLIAANFRRLGDSTRSRNTLVMGVAAFAGYVYVLFHLPPSISELPDSLFQLAQVGLVHVFGTWRQGEYLRDHEDRGGTFYSKWRAAGYSLLALPVVVVLFLVVGASTVSSPENIDISIESPPSVGQGDDFEIRIRVRNSASQEQTLVDLDIPGIYLDGIRLQKSEPPYLTSEELLLGGQVSYSYDLVIPPDSEITITLFASASNRGDFMGELDFCINAEMSCQPFAIRTIVD